MIENKLKYIIRIFPKSDLQASVAQPEGRYPFYTSSQDLVSFCDIAKYPADSITMGTGGNACVNYSDVPFSTSTDCFNFRCTKNSTKFVYYWIYSRLNVIDDLFFWGMGLRHLQKPLLGDQHIMLPSVDKQQKIVSYLDRKVGVIDRLIANIKQQIENLQNLKRSRINECFMSMDNKQIDNSFFPKIPSDFSHMKLNFLVSGIKDGTHGSFNRMTDGEMLLSAKNVSDGKIIYGEGESYISAKDYRSIIECGYPKKGDVLFTIVGSIGRTAVYNLDKPLAFQRSVLFVRPKPIVKPGYLNYFFMSDFFAMQYRTYIKQSAQAGIYGGDFKKCYVFYPNAEKQEKIISKLDKLCSCIDSLLRIKRKKIEELTEYKKSLIYEYVTGKKEVL